MKDIENAPLGKTIPVKTASLKPARQPVLSENKSLCFSGETALSTGWLASFGLFIKRHQKIISFIQWAVVLFYFSLLLLPLFSANMAEKHFYARVSGFSLLMFWGIGWPLIMLSMMLAGRVWCGLFCPDGTMTEFISRHGKKRSIPRWIRWKGWPCTVLVTTVLYGQLIGVYDSFPATLVLLGIPSSLALATGFLYGNGRRIWCMYLCPGNGIFGLLARFSPVHYRVDGKKWKEYAGSRERLDCPVLINVSQMQSMAGCHACGRCIGHRNAVELGLRSPFSEIRDASENRISGSESFLLLWGIIGICTAALVWRGTGIHVHFAQFLSHQQDLNASNLPWWIASGPSSFYLLLFILLTGSAIALAVTVLLWLAAFFTGKTGQWKQLALCLIPVTGFGIFLGLCQISFSLWQIHGFQVGWASILQTIVLCIAALFSVWLGFKTIVGQFTIANLIAFLVYCLPVTLLSTLWLIHFQI